MKTRVFSSRCIWKFTLEVTDRQAIEMPAGAEILDVQIQRISDDSRLLCLWAIVDSRAEREMRSIAIVGTGNPMSLDLSAEDYIGTVQDGMFVWHVFEVK